MSSSHSYYAAPPHSSIRTIIQLDSLDDKFAIIYKGQHWVLNADKLIELGVLYVEEKGEE